MSHTYRRRIIREKVLQLLYAFEMNAANIEPMIKETLADVEDPADKEFANNLINQIILNEKKLDELIKARVDNWDLSRIALIDRILLRIGICEILFLFVRWIFKKNLLF